MRKQAKIPYRCELLNSFLGKSIHMAQPALIIATNNRKIAPSNGKWQPIPDEPCFDGFSIFSSPQEYSMQLARA
jgi:hypothetical protein